MAKKIEILILVFNVFLLLAFFYFFLKQKNLENELKSQFSNIVFDLIFFGYDMKKVEALEETIADATNNSFMLGYILFGIFVIFLLWQVLRKYE